MRNDGVCLHIFFIYKISLQSLHYLLAKLKLWNCCTGIWHCCCCCGAIFLLYGGDTTFELCTSSTLPTRDLSSSCASFNCCSNLFFASSWIFKASEQWALKVTTRSDNPLILWSKKIEVDIYLVWFCWGRPLPCLDPPCTGWQEDCRASFPYSANSFWVSLDCWRRFQCAQCVP